MKAKIISQRGSFSPWNIDSGSAIVGLLLPEVNLFFRIEKIDMIVQIIIFTEHKISRHAIVREVEIPDEKAQELIALARKSSEAIGILNQMGLTLPY